MSTADPWKHRSANMVCQTCMWFVEKVSAKNTPSGLGRCRRHAPTLGGFPSVLTNDWCGDHKLDENAHAAQGVTVGPLSEQPLSSTPGVNIRA